MRWITRERIRVGRVGCAWLINRFIDTQAEFYFVPGAQLQDETRRLAAIPFHVDGTDLSRQGDISSFEAVMHHYELTNDPALTLLGRIVNTADIKTSPYRQREGYGLRAAIDGLLLLHTSDTAILQAGSSVYDALYAYCQDMILRGKPNGMFAE